MNGPVCHGMILSLRDGLCGYNSDMIKGKPRIRGVRLVLAALLLSTIPLRPILADVVITLQPGIDVSDGVSPGTLIPVDILLSVEEGDEPLADVRAIQLNFRASSPGISLDNFIWLLEPTIDAELYLLNRTFPQPSAAYISNSRREGMILDLDEDPLLVASMDVTVNGTGSIDLRFDDEDDITANDITLIRAGFGSLQEFTFARGNISGGRVSITVVGGGPDQDRDGVPDATDAFPTDPTESKDSDEDGVGDNADTDDDGDDIPDDDDDFPNDPDENVDTDRDGTGDAADTDDDNDNVLDTADAFPLDPTESRDTDGDGIGDNADPDSPDDRNQGPRATSGLCGATPVAAALALFGGLASLKFACRNRRRGDFISDFD